MRSHTYINRNGMDKAGCATEGHAVIVCLMNMDYMLECNCCRGIPL